MTLRPDIEALVQGALDGSLSPDDRKTLDQLLASDPAVRARAAELDQLSALLQSLGQVDAPPTLAADVLARIHASSGSSARVVEFSRSSHTHQSLGDRNSAGRGAAAMNKKIIWGLAAAAVLVLAVVGYVANPSVNQGTEATIGTAQRYQAPQIEAKDVAVGDTSAQALLQSETWDAIQKDETMRTLLQDASFRAKLQDPELRRGLADAELVRALRSPSLARSLADPEMVRRFNDPDLIRRLNDPELRKWYLNDPELLKKLNDPEFAKKLNDPELVKRLAADADLRAAFRSQAFVAALQNADFRARMVDANVMAALARPGFQAALRDPGFAMALRNARFGEAMASSRCPEWLCGSSGNSPIVDGAVVR